MRCCQKNSKEGINFKHQSSKNGGTTRCGAIAQPQALRLGVSLELERLEFGVSHNASTTLSTSAKSSITFHGSNASNSPRQNFPVATARHLAPIACAHAMSFGVSPITMIR